jgi:hydroxyacylglutathione hydrolase
MALVFEQIYTDGLAAVSYLIGDDDTATAAVIDPRADVEIYIDLARRKKLNITHIFETHIHADFVSGARELAARTGTAQIFLSHDGNPKYGFDHTPLKSGDRFTFGSHTLEARHTPGHTPEHISFLAFEKNKTTPWAVFTGDSLFINSAGRPDLLGKEIQDQLASQLYDTLRNFYLKLDDHVIVYPSHAHGSPCGASISDRLISTIGYERRFNPFLQITDRDAFKQHALSTAPPPPTYYPRMKRINAEVPKVLGSIPQPRGLTVAQFKDALERADAQLIDVRNTLAFGAGHIPGAINLAGEPTLSVWSGWIVNPDKPILLVLDDAQNLDEIVRLLIRVGFTNIAGHLLGGMRVWSSSGLPFATVPQMSVHEVRTADHLQLLDVRSPHEYASGHIPGAKHLFVPDLLDGKVAQLLDATKPTVTYCAGGYRASVAASILQSRGFKDVRTMPGSFSAWKKAGCPIER